MKLYTEEQVKTMLIKMDEFTLLHINRLMDELTPIELPSDEGVEEMGKDVIVYNDTKRGWFVEGLRFMRDKIQGGNK
jgi:hypothetical protein